ncbi:unnamed protein product, partial [Oppiella nova]
MDPTTESTAEEAVDSSDANQLPNNDNNTDINDEEVDQKPQIMAFIAECEERLKCKQSQREDNSKDNI